VTYKNPPIRIQKALEGIFVLLNNQVYDWETIKKKLKDSTDFK